MMILATSKSGGTRLKPTCFRPSFWFQPIANLYPESGLSGGPRVHDNASDRRDAM